MQSSNQDKSDIRARVFTDLRKVAVPDSRFNYDFSSFIADFAGSSIATEKLVQLPIYKSSHVIFVTPDNCLEELRLRALRDGKVVVTTTYGIRRGFWVLDPAVIEPGDYRVAVLLDGMERYASPVTLAELQGLFVSIALAVTGTGAVNLDGVRYGKGHGFFDLEWAMLYSIGLFSQETTVVGVVHECQLLDQELIPEDWDTVCDVVVTPERVISVGGARKPVVGILWESLRPGMLEDIPPLAELREMNIDIGKR